MAISKTVKVSLLVTVLLSVVAGLFFYLTKKKPATTDKSTVTDNNTVPTIGAAPITGTVNNPNTTDNVVIPPVMTTGQLGTARRTFPAAGNISGFAAKYGVTQQQALEFFTYDAYLNKLNYINPTFPDFWINTQPSTFANQWQVYQSLTDAQYNQAFS